MCYSTHKEKISRLFREISESMSGEKSWTLTHWTQPSMLRANSPRPSHQLWRQVVGAFPHKCKAPSGLRDDRQHGPALPILRQFGWLPQHPTAGRVWLACLPTNSCVILARGGGASVPPNVLGGSSSCRSTTVPTLPAGSGARDPLTSAPGAAPPRTRFPLSGV